VQVDLEALDRMVAEAEAAPILWTSRAAFLWNAYPAIAAELREARKRVRELEAEVQVRDDSANETLRILREALPNRGFHSEMEAAEAAAKEIAELRQGIESANGAAAHYLSKITEAQKGLDARDRRMKALGAAEELRRLAANTPVMNAERLWTSDQLLDRADAIAAERDHFADVGKMVNHPGIPESSGGER